MTITSKQISAALIIVAAGNSSRMGGTKKEYLLLNNGTVLSESARIFLQTFHFQCLVITIPKDGQDKARSALFADPEIKNLLSNTKLLFIEGGKTRQESVFKALQAIKIDSPDEIVLIHDGARPFVTSKVILDTIEATEQFGAAVPALQPVDTQKEIDDNGMIVRHLQRKNLAAVQTPQGFKYSELLEAHKKASLDGKEYTDDTEIWGNYCSTVKTVAGDSENKKITYPSDIQNFKNKETKMIRIGLGYDLHELVEGRPLMLGGLHIPFEKGEKAHSDGDVLLHALTDALLGAAGLGDIGSFFPPEDAKWKDADSKVLLKTVWQKILAEGWKLNNADCVIALEQPKFLPWRQKVCDSIAEILEVKPDQIFVKAKTGEKLGKIGQGKAIEVFVSCLLEKN